MRIYTAIVERCQDTGLYVGFIPGFQGAHTQAETLDALMETRKGGFARVYGYQPSSDWVVSPVQDIVMFDLFVG